jgi:hypothetical protein
LKLPRSSGCYGSKNRCGWTGLGPASSAKSLQAQPDGKVLITDGPYLETKEHIGGFWILEAADLDEALAWGRKGAVA